MTESNQRITVTKRMLKEGLIRLLKEKPLEKISITELCREAEINRTTFYRHYELPKDVLMEMQGDFFEDAVKNFHNPMTTNDIERFFSYLYEHSELAKLFLQYYSDADWENLFTRIINSFPDKMMPKVFRNIDENSAKLLSTYLAGGAFFLARKWIMEDIPIPPKDVAAIALNILDKDRLF